MTDILGSKRFNRILIALVGFATVILINQVASSVRLRWDLTEESRYTLHPSTEALLEDLNEPVTIEVFLEGTLLF